MGNNLWIQKHISGGVPAPLDEAIVEDVFGQHATRRDATGWVVDLGDRDGAELYYGAGGNSMMLAHYGGPRLVALIFDFLQRTGSVAYWPDEAPCGAVADAAVLATLPQDMVDTIRPVVVASPEELDKAICGHVS